MFIRYWLPYIVFSYFAIHCLEAKPVSLNDLIAAEERQKGNIAKTPKPKLLSETSERFSLSKVLSAKPVKLKKYKRTGNIFPRGKISALKYRKTFQIKSPLKSKKSKYVQRTRNKRRNQSIEREIGNNEKLHKKYIPLIRSLSLLFDNIIDDDFNDSFEFRRRKSKNIRSQIKRNETGCTCNATFKSSSEETKSSKEAIISTTPFVEVTLSTEPSGTETPATATPDIATSDVSSVGPYTDLSLLLTRDTNSSWRNDTGVSERSSPTFHSSAEGNITWHHRNSELNSGRGENTTNANNNEENPFSPSPNYASGAGYRGGISRNGDDTRVPVYRRGIDETNFSEESKNSYGDIRGNFDEFKSENKFKVGGDETESTEFLSVNSPRDRGFISEDNVNNNTEPLQSEKNYKEGIFHVAHDIARDQRLALENVAPSTENKGASSTNATMISIEDLNHSVTMLQNSPKHKAPYVTIIDGYSVARDKNGSNKLTEKSIRIHS